jgi:predicted GTPase
VTITVVGQVKAGKSSLINALLGEQRAETAVLPLTREITKYRLHLPDASDGLILLDTVGYGHKGPREDQLAETLEAVKSSDLVLLVLNARDPARQPDLLLLQAIKKHFEEHVTLRMPPIVAVMTFIDVLPPAMEWQPPYEWNRPTRAKEQHVVEASRALQETLGEYLCGVVPVCTLPGKVYGVQEHLVPMLIGLLDEARGVSVLRLMTQERNWDKLAKAYAQALSLAKEVWRVAAVGSSGDRQK